MRNLTYLSVASGIAADTVAWQPLGWRCLAYAEIGPFPCAVLEWLGRRIEEVLLPVLALREATFIAEHDKRFKEMMAESNPKKLLSACPSLKPINIFLLR